MARSANKITNMKILKKKMRKLEKQYDRVPEAAILSRERIMTKMQKLTDQQERLKT